MRFSFNRTFLIALACGLFSNTLLADGGELSLNDQTFKLAADMSLGNNGAVAEVTFLHHEDRGDFASLGLLKYDNAGSEGLDAGIGVKLAYLDGDVLDSNGGALALGGKVHYVPPRYDRLNVGAYGWFGPDVLTFSNLDSYSEVGAYLGYNVIRGADVFVGFRHLKGKFEASPDVTVDSGMHIGIRMNF